METHFPEFQKIEDLGSYAVAPKGSYKSWSECKAEDILSTLILDEAKATPPKLIDGYEKLAPATFPSLKRNAKLNKFPHSTSELIPLYIAKSNGHDLESIDFVLGGSALNALAERETPGGGAVYALSKVGNAVIMAKYSEYEKNYADIGFQFERLVTNGSVEHDDDFTSYEHVQMYAIGDHKILFSADADAVDTEGNRCEIKAANPRYYKLKVIFQMISSDSQVLVQGDRKQTNLLNIKTKTLDSLIKEKKKSECFAAQDKIIGALAEIKDFGKSMKDGSTYEVVFESDGGLSFKESKKINLLPPVEEVNLLLKAADQKN